MTDKNKNIVLVISFAILLLCSYFFSIQKTFDLKKRVQHLTKEKEFIPYDKSLDNKKYILVSNEGGEYEVTRSLLRNAKTITNMIEDCSDDNPIYLPLMSNDELELMIEFFSHIACLNLN